MAHRDQLLSKGRANVSALRHALQHEQLTNEVKAARIKAACWDTMVTPQAVIVPVSQTCLTSGLGEFEPSDEMVTRFTIWSLGPVQNMPTSKLSAEEARRLQQVRVLLYWLHAPCVQGRNPCTASQSAQIGLYSIAGARSRAVHRCCHLVACKSVWSCTCQRARCSMLLSMHQVCKRENRRLHFLASVF